MSILLKMAWRNVWRNPRRSLLTLGAIAFACVLLVFMLSLQFGSYETMINASLAIRTGHLQIQAPGYHDKQRMRDTIENPQPIADAVVRMEKVRAATMRANGFALVSSVQRSAGIVVTGVEPVNEPKVTTVASLVRSGRWLADRRAYEAVIGRLLAVHLKVESGDELTLLGQGPDGSIAAGVVRVCGIFSSGIDEVDRSTMLMPLAAFQELFAMETAVHEIAVVGHTLDDSGPLHRQIAQQLPSLTDGRPPVVLDWQTLTPGLMESIAMDLSMGLIMYAILIIVVAFSIFNTFLMVIFERTREFGVLMALGTSPGRLLRLVLGESMLITLMGISLGMLAGALLTLYFQSHGIDLSDHSDLLSQYGISGLIYPRLSWLSLLAGPAAVWLITVAAALFPALKVSRLKPVTAIAHH